MTTFLFQSISVSFEFENRRAENSIYFRFSKTDELRNENFEEGRIQIYEEVGIQNLIEIIFSQYKPE